MIGRHRAALAQVAFSVVDLAATERWFREGLGFRPAGGSRWRMRGPLASAVQGLPRVASTCWWLVDRNEFFQLELFQFERPLARLMAHDFRPCDIGYTRIGVWVADFDRALARLERLGSPPLSRPDRARRGASRLRAQPRRGLRRGHGGRPAVGRRARRRADRTAPVAVRSVTLSVPDLARSEAFFSRGLGLASAPMPPLHAPEHEALWGLAGARTRSSVFAAGSVLVELVQYLDPVGRPRPPDHRISDQGILNIAFGARSRRDHRELYRRARAAGARANRRPLHLPGGGRRLRQRPGRLLGRAAVDVPGFGQALGLHARARSRKRPRADTHAVERTVRIAAPARTTWDAITDAREHARVARSRRVSAGPSTAHRSPTAAGPSGCCGFPGASITERVVAYEPPTSYRYQVTKGSPFICHQGEIRLRADGDQTEVTWRIRFRPKLPGTGRPLAMVLSRLLGRVLRSGLKPHVEALRPAVSRASRAASASGGGRARATRADGVCWAAQGGGGLRWIFVAVPRRVRAHARARAGLRVTWRPDRALGGATTAASCSRATSSSPCGAAVLVVFAAGLVSHHQARRGQGRLARDGLVGERGRRRRDLRCRHRAVHGRRLPSGHGSRRRAGVLGRRLAGLQLRRVRLRRLDRDRRRGHAQAPGARRRGRPGSGSRWV